MKNKELIELIKQTLHEPRLLPGAYGRFADKFNEKSEQKIDRVTVYQWLHHRGIPPKHLGTAEALSRENAKYKKDILTSRKLRPDLYNK